MSEARAVLGYDLEPQSVLRNPVIVGVFRDLGSRYIERLGTGIRRMTLAMEEHGLPRPRFEEMGSEFQVILIGPGERFMEEMAVRPAWAEGLNERQVAVNAGDHYARVKLIRQRSGALSPPCCGYIPPWWQWPFWKPHPSSARG